MFHRIQRNSVTKKFCDYSKRAQTCYLLCKRQGCYHSASKTHSVTYQILCQTLNSPNSLNSMKVLLHLGKTPLFRGDGDGDGDGDGNAVKSISSRNTKQNDAVFCLRSCFFEISFSNRSTYSKCQFDE